MVLQDMNQAPDSFTELPNSSDNDPYASPSPSSPPSGERFDASKMPKPIPVIAPFIGFSSRTVRFKADSMLSFSEKKLGRTLHPEEAQALAFHIYKLEKTKSYYAAAGVAAGTYRWYATMATHQYPFYKPKPESIDPNKFGLIKGPYANMARQTWRFGLYALVAGEMGTIIGQLIAQPVAAYETSIDPKLEEFSRDIKAASTRDERSNTERGRLIEERRKDFEARRRQEGTGGMTPPYGSRSGRPTPESTSTSDDDDMSPTAGNEPWGTSPSTSWSDFAADEQPKQQPDRQRQPSYQSRQPSQFPPSQTPYDADTSPTAGLFHSETTTTAEPPQASASSGLSSWERLRRGASAPSQAPSGQQDRTRFGAMRQQGGGTAGDDGESERARAQREFDERLERERSGEDFNEGERKW